MRRHASVARLHASGRDEYLRLHAAVWPGVERALLSAGVKNHSLFLHENVLFRYFEVETNAEAALESLASDSAMRPWIAATLELLSPMSTTSDPSQAVWQSMPEVYHLG